MDEVKGLGHIVGPTTYQLTSLSPEPLFRNMRRQMSDSYNGKSIRHKSEGWGFESPSGWDIFCPKNIDAFTRTSILVSKMNDVART